jgi:aryl-alcohol dehydrogenase-like predicted oxidoreductase
VEFRQLGGSGLKVPVLSFGTGTFGGGNEFFKAWGASDVEEATHLVSICLDAGVNLFDSADIYSGGLSEEILGKAIAGRRHKVLISTKGSFRAGTGANDSGSSRHHLIDAVEGSLKRLGTDYIDIYQLHGFDVATPVEETLATLDGMVRAGKIRYIGCSNFSGWELMKSLAVSEPVWMVPLRGASGVLLAGRPRVRMGTDAAGAGPARRRAGVESAGVGPADGQDPAQSAPTGGEPFAGDGGYRASGGR